MASRREVLHLYKLLLRESKKLSSYNFREYAVRRVRDAFKDNAGVNDPHVQSVHIQFARENLQMLHRQAVISSLYSGPNIVVEKESGHR